MLKKSNGFKFKQFFIAHDLCAMKVTTDAILLGCWVDVIRRVETVLDIGTGSGILALMLAQRTTENVSIDAVELEECAFHQAWQNVMASPWYDKVNIIHNDIMDYADKTAMQYDIIVTNPPYFQPSVACRTQERRLARYTDSLTHERLLHISQKLLKSDGRLYVVLPANLEHDFLMQAEQMGWHRGASLYVKEQENKQPYLLLLEMALYSLDRIEQILTIRDDHRQYSQAYRQFAKAFYLAF